jgi:hypothetical protein
MSRKQFYFAGLALLGAFVSPVADAEKIAAAVHILLDGNGNIRTAIVAGAFGEGGATATTVTDGRDNIDVFAIGSELPLNTDVDNLYKGAQNPARAIPGDALPPGSEVDFDAITASYRSDPPTKLTADLVTDSATTAEH